MSSIHCVKADNSSVSLKKTFEFISKNQLSSNGYLMETTVYLAINLNNLQIANFDYERTSSANTVSGLIGEITDTTVVILSPTNCPNYYDEYTIQYSQIIEIGSSSFYDYYDKLLLELGALPPLCKNVKTQYTELLYSIEKAIRKYKDVPGYNIKVIFNDLTSRKLPFDDVEVVSNLFISEKTYVIPINYIGGYAIIPPCSKNDCKEETTEKSNFQVNNGGNYVY